MEFSIDAIASALPTVVPTVAPTVAPVVNSMTTGERAALGIETTVTGMVIVFAVLIILSLIVMLVSRVLNSSKKEAESKAVAAPEAPVVSAPATAADAVVPQAGTKGTGHLVTDGVGSEEEVAVIMAAVAAHSGASLDSLEFKSIKAVD